MADCTWFSLPCHNHCCTISAQAKPVHRSFTVNPSFACRDSFSEHPVCVVRPITTTRCLSLGHCLHFPYTACETSKNFEGSLHTAGFPVLARRETDGYYYPGTIIKDIEGKKRTFLVQFPKPFAGGEEDAPCVQKTASSDIHERVHGMTHSILPGDKVLAPWEPEQERYGPGTVIRGMETRDPLREKEDEEITVSFWNGKKAKVSLGVALWIPPMQWERIVEMICMPLSSRKQFEGQLQRPAYFFGSCRPIPASTYTCPLGGLCRLHRPYCAFIHPYSRCFHHTCSLLGHPQFISCCCPKYSSCWWVPSLAELPHRDVKEEEFSRKPTTALLAVEGPPKEESTAASSSCSSNSSSCSSSSKTARETGLPKNTMVDHAVNTDSSLFDKPKLQEIRRPDWKYWKRSHPSSHYKSFSIQHFP